MAATASTCQAVWLRGILSNLWQEQDEATEVFCDNKSAVLLAKNPMFHCRTKHVEIKHHFIKELMSKQEVKLESCGTKEQLADLMTKSLLLKKHENLCIKLGLSKFE